MACNKNEWHPVHWINYWISTIAKIPSTEQDGGINVMSMGRNGSSLAWIVFFINYDYYLSNVILLKVKYLNIQTKWV